MDKVTFLQRLQAIIIDFAVTIVIIMPIAFLAYAFKLLEDEVYQHIFLSFVFATLFCKDIINGRSFGKYATKLQILTSDNREPSCLRLVIRNITIVIWPVELIVSIFSPERRLGDFLTGTKVVAYSLAKGVRKSWVSVIAAYLITIAVLYVLLHYIALVAIPGGFTALFYR